MNLGIVNGGVAASVMSASAEAVFSVRVASGTGEEAKSLLHKLQEFTDNDPDVEVDLQPGGTAPTDLDTDEGGFNVITVNYGTDIQRLSIHDRERTGQ
ncbi:hypothetical protein CNMCM8980_007802 [Aspergillus fumigatiaffinis]|jgi:acetylornithine deacetylase|nr:hypothetical protein CNMCM5878_010316 [Aspergillus fumigatiaffinis]KAF4228617.1 hypothetical protein CNMCM6457_006824 [Aspergillus fumigatiaffinis]KAF4247122.1 hypothetical protein CNMCM8980_007802 [Aspergillus fumigatiaffinis]